MTPNVLSKAILFLVALSTGLLGSSMILIGEHKHISRITDFYSVSQLLTPEVFNAIAALFFIVCAIAAFLVMMQNTNKWLSYLLITVSVIPLIALFGQNMWIEQLGGFPAIGAGQGVIKYFALLAIGITLLKPSWLNNKQLVWINLIPVLLVLIWIGGMKFTNFEAEGIKPLVETSPLMAWMYNIWDVQTVSNLIGVYDLIAVGILVAGVFYPKLLMPAIVMSGAVFVTTQTFLLSFEASLSGETLLTMTGHFLIKDLWYIANLMFVWMFIQQSKNELPE